MRIDDACFVVVDTETTGVRARADRLIEVAAVKVERGAVVERFSQLIDPGCAVPSRITRITGITTAMVFGKPRAADVMPWFMEFVGDAVLVAHNLPFDLGFLSAELERCGLPPWAGRSLCTLRLARRLLRGLRSKGLASLADFYGIPIHGRHRALGDAEATAQVLLRFLEQLRQEFAIEDLESLSAFQHKSYRQIRRAASHLEAIRERILPDVPNEPGVYFMKNARDEIIYIGKARNLGSRVRSYFNAVEAHPERLRQLVAEVRDVGWKTTESELAALLLESRLIKAHQPRFNRAQLQYRARPFLRLDVQSQYPRLTVSAVAHPDGAEYFGPLASRREAEFLSKTIDEFFGLRECDDGTYALRRECALASMGRCPHTPCVGPTAGAYGDEVDRVRRFLSGEDQTVLQKMEHAMKQAAADLEFERASEYRDAIERLKQLRSRQRDLARPVFKQNGVALWQRSDGQRVALVIGGGRLLREIRLSDDADSWMRLRAAIDESQQTDSEQRYWKEEADELRLVQQWMYRNRDEVLALEWDDAPRAEDLIDKLRDMIVSAPATRADAMARELME